MQSNGYVSQAECQTPSLFIMDIDPALPHRHQIGTLILSLHMEYIQ